ncbi:MAG: hypothetical protein ACLP0J_28700 [Solirubrobacteraceae bacterium]
MAKTQQGGDWVTIQLDDGRWEARCRLIPRSGRPAFVELHICGADGDPPDGEITVSGVVRQLTMTKIHAALAPKRSTRLSQRATNRELHGQRRDGSREDLLALVATSHEEYVAAGSKCPDRDAWDFLTSLYDVESSPDWPWPRSIPRRYKRSSVRTLIRDARSRGYDHGYGYGQLSATATLKLAKRRKAMWSDDSLD